ncbi:MAG: 2-C-methyl-D-erythritol 2,4-cyclodiphosphate synthase [Alphaproteobacteria bacterium]|jgi:2-C-methyl-D-erythritol 4-phosphate cytidylyltransferase/2-C-methyl-D-erythritol 2,4-cyclodiphosphate synthase|nr:2-C-methyl-D-erythritol 2,4-cyclodiphosphate synthase [Alphaproteobacteria bacterium]
MKENSTVLILLAAGKSTRFSTETPKQYVNINGKTIFEEALLSNLPNSNIDYILPVISEFHVNIYQDLIKNIENSKLLPFVLGGKERCYSVLNALQSLKNIAPQKVLIHDCARVFTPSELINNIITNIESKFGVIPALPIVDTIKSATNNLVVNEINRENLFTVQTPQGFIYKEILESYEKFQDCILTDDSSYYLKNGYSVKIIKGSPLANKITYQQDLEILKKMQNYETCVGMGQDIHQFENENIKKDLYLCGVKIPHNKGLKAHSDGDVVLHSLVDAILGGLALGDIGDYFPPSEEKWKNQPSKIFLEFAKQQVLKMSGRIINIDITILAEAPKISKYKQAMKEFLATTLNISINRINIKATTMEKLGTIGRGEGIFASSIVSIELPERKNND